MGGSRRSCLGEGHADSVLRPQDDHRACFDRLARSQLEIVFSEQNAQNHEDLQHGVVAADTAPRPGSEGQIGEGRVKLLIRFGEALRVETLRVLPVLRRMVRAVNEHNDRRPSRVWRDPLHGRLREPFGRPSKTAGKGAAPPV